MPPDPSPVPTRRTDLGDNDSQIIMTFDERGNAINSVAWDEARGRLAAALEGEGGSNPGVLVTKAEFLLCALFTGRSRTHG